MIYVYIDMRHTGFRLKEGDVKTDAKKSAIRRNLADAGCNAVIADKFMELLGEGKKGEQLRLLKTHRAALLKKVRDNQKRIDCLDYLIFTMTQEAK